VAKTATVKKATAKKAAAKKAVSKKGTAKKGSPKKAAPRKTSRDTTTTPLSIPRRNGWQNTLSARKTAILEYNQQMAAKRDDWRAKNAGFYDDDMAFLKFLIPEGSRILDLGCGTGAQLAGLKPSFGMGVDFSANMVDVARSTYPEHEYPELQFRVGDVEQLNSLRQDLQGPYDFILLSDTLGFVDDCQAMLEQIHDLCDEETRIVITYYSHLWEPVLRAGEATGLKMPQPEVNFLSPADISNILGLSDFDVIKTEWRQLVPARLFGVGTAINRYIGTLPLIRKLSLRHFIVARSQRKAKRKAAPKRAKAKRSSKNEKLESQAQAQSRGTASTYVQPEAVAEPKTVRKGEGDAPDILDMCGGDPVAAARHAKHMALTQIFSEDCIDMDDVL